MKKVAIISLLVAVALVSLSAAVFGYFHKKESDPYGLQKAREAKARKKSEKENDLKDAKDQDPVNGEDSLLGDVTQ